MLTTEDIQQIKLALRDDFQKIHSDIKELKEAQKDIVAKMATKDEVKNEILDIKKEIRNLYALNTIMLSQMVTRKVFDEAIADILDLYNTNTKDTYKRLDQHEEKFENVRLALT